MPPLPYILHNLADHADVLLRILGDEKLDPEFRQRLLDHIAIEEEENSRALEELSRTRSDTVVRKALDHSYFIQRMIRDASIPLDLKRELLDHFAEEHREWQASPGGPRDAGAGWTVGSLRAQGGE